MKTIVAGDRRLTNYSTVGDVLDAHDEWKITTVISGTCRGADLFGEQWAEENNVPIMKFPADWPRYHRGAGPIRNEQMAKEGEALIAFLATGSRGTKNMIETAKKHSYKYIKIIHVGAQL